MGLLGSITSPISPISTGGLIAASFTITLSIFSPAMVSLTGWIGLDLSSTVSRGFSNSICWYVTSSFVDISALMVTFSSERVTTFSSLAKSCTARKKGMLPIETIFCVCSSLSISLSVDPCSSFSQIFVKAFSVSFAEVSTAWIFLKSSHSVVFFSSFSLTISSAPLSIVTGSFSKIISLASMSSDGITIFP